jgi:hypothetical protein
MKHTHAARSNRGRRRRTGQASDGKLKHPPQKQRDPRHLAEIRQRMEREALAAELPDDVALKIAAATEIRRSIPMTEFRAALAGMCGEVSSQCQFISLLKARRPVVALLNRVARTTRQLSDDLARLSRSESVTLDGFLVAIFPHMLLKSHTQEVLRAEAEGVVEVDGDRRYAFLDSEVHAYLLSGLALCAEVAADKMSMSEVGQRLGVNIRFNQERYEEWRRKHRNVPSVRNVPLRLLITRLRTLIVDQANGQLTLWNGPRGGRPNGTLPDVLAILRPYLPDVIPAKMNYRTLYRYLNVRS